MKPGFWFPRYTGKRVKSWGFKFTWPWKDRTMTLTEDQIEKIEDIVSCFETGSPERDYGKVTMMKGDTGGLTYGAHQASLNSGNLYKLIRAYVQSPSGILQIKEKLGTYLGRIEDKDPRLNHDQNLHTILREAGEDPEMKRVQDEFFRQVYWTPAYKWATDNGFTLPLSMAVIYDSFIHSGSILRFLRNRFRERVPKDGGKEKEWIDAYMEARHQWLANHSNKLLRKTIYRTQAFRDLIDRNNWQLESPFKVRTFTL